MTEGIAVLLSVLKDDNDRAKVIHEQAYNSALVLRRSIIRTASSSQCLTIDGILVSGNAEAHIILNLTNGLIV